MENCKFTKLKGASDNANLKTFGEIIIKMGAGHAFYGSSSVEQTVTALTDEMTIGGSREVTLQQDLETTLTPNITGFASFENKYAIKSLYGYMSLNLDELEYNTVLTKLNISTIDNDSGVSGKLSSLTRAKDALTELEINDMNFVPDAYFSSNSITKYGVAGSNLSDVLSHFPNAVDLALYNAKGNTSVFANNTRVRTITFGSVLAYNVEGNISDFAGCTNLTSLNLNVSFKVTGSLGSLINNNAPLLPNLTYLRLNNFITWTAAQKKVYTDNGCDVVGGKEVSA